MTENTTQPEQAKTESPRIQRLKAIIFAWKEMLANRYVEIAEPETPEETHTRIMQTPEAWIK